MESSSVFFYPTLTVILILTLTLKELLTSRRGGALKHGMGKFRMYRLLSQKRYQIGYS